MTCLIDEQADAVKATNYLGCFRDTGTRDLKEEYKNTATMSLAECLVNCKGYRYLGLQVNLHVTRLPPVTSFRLDDIVSVVMHMDNMVLKLHIKLHVLEMLARSVVAHWLMI